MATVINFHVKLLHLTKAISFIVYYIVTFCRLRLLIDISIFWCLTAVCLFLLKNYYYESISLRRFLSRCSMPTMHVERDVVLPIIYVYPFVQCRYCVKTNGYIVTLFGNSGGGVVLVFLAPTAFDFDSTAVRLPFECNSTALRPFNDIRYDRHFGLNK